MIKKKPGIFDPWRQATPPPAPVAEPDPSLTPKDEDAERRHCVEFKGRNAGINVWLYYAPEDPEAACVGLLVDLVHRISILDNLEGVFKAAGVVLGEQPDGLTLYSSDGRGVNLQGADPVRTLAHAFRQVSRARPEVAKLLKDTGVKPYVA